MSKPAWIDGIPEWAISGLCVFEVFRGLGFAAKDIFFHASDPVDNVSPDINGKCQVNIVLLAQCREFVVTVAFVAEPQDVICEKWTRFAERAAAGEFQDDWNSVAEKNRFWREKSAIIAGVLMKGFRLPSLEN